MHNWLVLLLLRKTQVLEGGRGRKEEQNRREGNTKIAVKWRAIMQEAKRIFEALKPGEEILRTILDGMYIPNLFSSLYEMSGKEWNKQILDEVHGGDEHITATKI